MSRPKRNGSTEEDKVLPEYIRRIRDLRDDNDLKQREIADILHISQRIYSDYEHNNVRIPVDILITLARYYDVDMDYICGASNTKQPFPKE